MNFLKFSLSLMLLSGSILYADLDESTFSEEKNPPEKESYPFTIEADGNIVGKSKFNKSGIRDQHLNFHLVDADLSMVFYYEKSINEGAYFDLGYTSTLLSWKQNPYFYDDEFNTINLTLGGFTERIEGWNWLGQATVHLDPIKDFTFADYTYYDLIAWGRYHYCRGIDLHLGLIVQTGMKIDRVYPIIGFDWQVNSKWKINAVFPVNVSVVYTLDKCWSLSFAGRTFDLRHRVAKNEPLSRALFTYRNIGFEFVLKYDCDARVVANIHAGYTTGGMLKIANRHYNEKHHFKFDSAPYGGAEVLVKF